MEIFSLLFRKGWVLGMALALPVTLPAGAGPRTCMELLMRRKSDPILLTNNCSLRSSPESLASTLRLLEMGTPVDILRLWHTSDGNFWCKIEIASAIDGGFDLGVRRGWLRI